MKKGAVRHKTSLNFFKKRTKARRALVLFFRKKLKFFHINSNRRREYALYFEKILAWSAVLGILLSSAQFLNYYRIPQAKAATYTFLQSSWASGATSTTTGHPSGQTGWAYYSAIDSGLTATSTVALAYDSGSWSTQTSGVTNILYGVKFVSTSVGWAVGTGGKILYTSNGGSTWTAQTSGTTGGFRAIDCTDTSNCWATENTNGGLFKTTNGGSTWTNPASPGYGHSIDFVDTSNGWIGSGSPGAGGYVFHTTGGGSSWTSALMGSNYQIDAVRFVDTNTGWQVFNFGGSGFIYKTTAGGDQGEWTAQTPPTNTELNGLELVDANTVWTVGANGSTGMIGKTTNGGTNWSAQTSGVSVTLRGIDCIDANSCWVVGDSGTIITTTNGGTNWSSQTSGTSTGLYAVSFADSANGWAVGNAGAILKFSTGYPTTGKAVTSSAFNAADPAAVIMGLQWSETSLPSNTSITVSLRTASSSAGLSSASWTNFTNASSSCSKVSTTVTCTSAAIPSALQDSSNDQWFQYKVTLASSDGVDTPVADNVQITYSINTPPEFDRTYGTNGISIATSTNTSTTTINYKALDSDTNDGTVNPLQIQASFEYSLNGGGSWTSIGSSYLTASSTALKSIASTTYTTFSPQWFPKSQISGQYSTSTQIRTTLTDNEAYNYSTTTTSASFTLDTRNPTSSVLAIDASSDLWTVTATDDSSFQMNLSTDGTFSDANYVSYAATTTRALGAEATGYIRFRDSSGNITDVSAATPQTPTNIIYQDISNASTSEWREFIAWGVVSDPAVGFAGYQIYRSTDGSSYSQVGTSTNRLVNYYLDTGLTQGQTYYYKIITLDSNGSRSEYSSSISDAADGQGGTDITSPNISSVSVATTSTSYAQITWTTDEVSNSYVGYATATSSLPSSPIQETGVVSMVTSHSVYLTGLSASTTYYFYAKSLDPSNNSRTSDNSGAYYSFSTRPGAIISGIGAENISTQSANIVWYTDTASDSHVVYSTSTSFTNSTTAGTNDTASGSGSNYYHSVALSGLTGNTTYYYYVQSRDSSNNLAQDTKSGNYYSFQTITDATAPTISNVSASVTDNHSATVSWNTNEPATSRASYGTTASYGTSTATSTELVLTHSAVLSDLTSSTTYHYAVFSTDAAGNTAQSADGTFATLADTIVNTTSTVTVNTTSTETVNTTSTVTVNTTSTVVISGGGGGSSADDITAPVMSGISGIWDGTAAIFSWNTNENTIGIVELGLTDGYELGLRIKQYKPYSNTIKLQVDGLNSSKIYHYRAIAIDKAGNSFVSSDNVLKPAGEQVVSETIQETAGTESFSEAEIQTVTDSVTSVLSNAVAKISPQELNSAIRGISDGPQFLGGEPKINVETNQVEITWKTDKESNSLITFARGDDYERQKDAAFQVEVGNSDELITDHKIVLSNLFPSTRYYFRLKSTAPVGKISQSDVYSFVTRSLSAEITKIDFQSLGSGRVRMYWEVNMPTDAIIKHANLSTEEAGEFRDGIFTNVHDHVLSLDPNTEYSVSVGGAAKDGKSRVSSPDFKINTGKDIVPPITSHVKTESAFIKSAFGDRVQTIITWTTDELAASQVFYSEGVGKQDIKANGVAVEPEKTAALQHISVISNFKPNTIYQFVVVSRDKAGNEAVSQPFTVLTPQQAKSVLQLIIGNFENTFGWLKKLQF